jgi:hypothetical protein
MTDKGLNGEALLIAGGEAYAIEEGISYTQPQWMGETLSNKFNLGQEILGSGDNWTSKGTGKD